MSKTEETKRGRKSAIRSILCCQLSTTISTLPSFMVLEHYFFATVLSPGIFLSFEVQIKDLSPMFSIISWGSRKIFHVFSRSFSGWHRQETLGKKHGTIHGNEKYLMLHIPLLLGFRSPKFQGVPQPSLIYSNKHSN